MYKKSGIISVFVNIILGAVVALVCFFAMLAPALNDNASYKEKACIYSDCTYDFIAPSPVKEQVEEMKAQPFIKSVYEYYLINSTVSFGRNSVRTKAMFSESDNLEITPFNNERLVCEKEGGELYITKSIAEYFEANTGDEVTVGIADKSITLKVGKIFLDDAEKEGKVIFTLTDSLKDEILTDKMSLTGVYIEANDKTAVKNYLKSYIPMGRLLTRDNFDSDLQYDSYVEDFMSRDYSSLINDKSGAQNDALKVNEVYLTDSEDMLLKAVVLIGALMFIIVILNLCAVLAYNKFVARNSGYTLSFTWKTVLFFCSLACLAVLCCIATLGILCSVQTAGMLFFNSFNSNALTYSLLSAFIGGLVGGIIVVAFCALKAKKANENG